MCPGREEKRKGLWRKRKAAGDHQNHRNCLLYSGELGKGQHAELQKTSNIWAPIVRLFLYWEKLLETTEPKKKDQRHTVYCPVVPVWKAH